MSMNYTVSSTITVVGISAAINAGSTGPQINVAGFRLGSLSAAEGAVALPSDIDVDGFVYQGTIAQMGYVVIDQDTVMWTIGLDTTVGNFEIGNVGIILTGGVLFAKAVMPGASPKYQSAPPTTVGNVKYYNILMRLANAASLINLSIVQALEMSLPEVPTELQLPNPLLTPFDCYLVDNHTQIGIPTTSVRLNGRWWHSPHRAAPGQGQAVISTLPSSFDGSCFVGGAVYLNSSTDKFSLYTSGQSATPVGIMTSTFEVTVVGTLPISMLGFAGGSTVTVGAGYYVGTDGRLTATGSGNLIGIGVGATEMFIYFSASSGGNSELKWINVSYSASSVETRFNEFIELTGTTSFVVQLASPAGNSGGYVVYNLSSAQQSLTTSAGNGLYANSDLIVGGPPNNYLTIQPGCAVILHSDGVNWIMVSELAVASTVNRGIARQATLAEVLAGVTTASVPAFVTPEELAAKIAAIPPDIDIISSTSPFVITGVGAIIIATTHNLGQSKPGAVGSTGSWSIGGGNGTSYVYNTITVAFMQAQATDVRWLNTTIPGTWQLIQVGGQAETDGAPYPCVFERIA